MWPGAPHSYLAWLAAPAAYLLAAALPKPQIDASWGALVIAGLMVGIGTRYGPAVPAATASVGCRGIHRVSLAAPRRFMCAGFVTVFVIRPLIGI
jgi:uncharacterized membrane protein YedE/YeeE